MNLDFSEELDDRVSEKISGGSDVDAQIVEQLRIIQMIGDPKLQTKVVEQIKKIFPKGIGNAASLSCAQDVENLKCEISSNGKRENFIVPLK